MFGICESHEFEFFEFRLDEFPVFDDVVLFLLFDEYGDEDWCADVCVELFLLPLEPVKYLMDF